MPFPRRALILAVLAAWAIVFARSAVFIIYPQSFFDSDQAIVGLMAKHLTEGRAFPLFFYGQTYLLAVEAWVAALCFLAGGPTVAMLHTATLAFNLAAVALLIGGLVRGGGLTTVQAFIASLFFILVPPYTSARLIEAMGANIEPFVYIPLLWMLRDRPIWFGLVLGIGVLNREFTIYALPALAAIQWATGTLVSAYRLRTWLVAACAFTLVWLAVAALTPYADLGGPGTRGQQLQTRSVIDNVMDRADIIPRDLPARGAAMLRQYFPRQIGARRTDHPVASQGRDWLFWPVMLGLAAALARVLQRAWTLRAAPLRPRTEFGWYLLIVGVIAGGAYALTRDVTETPIDRYMLLVLYVPIGIVALFLALEPRAWVRHAAVALVAGWAAMSVVDHARLFHRYWSGREGDPAQALADGLEQRGVKVAAANYWRAYKLTFLTRERVKIASSDASRIEEYDRLAEAEGGRLVVMQQEPCESDLAPLAEYYLCRAGP